ncbi:MAG: hypothetical protein JWL69_1391 [Phycisphaerales bacterium]|nr:hypothetical protein [Phycisphaerales bacterium]
MRIRSDTVQKWFQDLNRDMGVSPMPGACGVENLAKQSFRNIAPIARAGRPCHQSAVEQPGAYRDGESRSAPQAVRLNENPNDSFSRSPFSPGAQEC